MEVVAVEATALCAASTTLCATATALTAAAPTPAALDQDVAAFTGLSRMFDALHAHPRNERHGRRSSPATRRCQNGRDHNDEFFAHISAPGTWLEDL
jgi:hypothetical protein